MNTLYQIQTVILLLIAVLALTALIGLRNEGVISDEVFHRLEHELDVEVLRSGLGELRLASADTSSPAYSLS
jgi:hypothetical protein